MAMTPWHEEVWQWIAAVPPGTVASYGQIAQLAGHPRHARHVGAILRKLPKDTTLPWHRILRSDGALGFPADSAPWRRQRALLAAEGITLQNQRVSMARHQWCP